MVAEVAQSYSLCYVCVFEYIWMEEVDNDNDNETLLLKDERYITQ